MIHSEQIKFWGYCSDPDTGKPGSPKKVPYVENTLHSELGWNNLIYNSKQITIVTWSGQSQVEIWPGHDSWKFHISTNDWLTCYRRDTWSFKLEFTDNVNNCSLILNRNVECRFQKTSNENDSGWNLVGTINFWSIKRHRWFEVVAIDQLVGSTLINSRSTRDMRLYR